VAYVTSRYRRGLHNPGVFAFLHYVCTLRHPDYEWFFDRLLTGTQLVENSMTHKLFDRLLVMREAKALPLEVAAVVAKAWNATILGTKRGVNLRWTAAEAFPEIL
jgi:hypothetical protein